MRTIAKIFTIIFLLMVVVSWLIVSIIPTPGNQNLGLLVLVFYIFGHLLAPISASFYSGYVAAIISFILAAIIVINNFIHPSDSPLNFIAFYLLLYALIAAIITKLYRGYKNKIQAPKPNI